MKAAEGRLAKEGKKKSGLIMRHQQQNSQVYRGRENRIATKEVETWRTRRGRSTMIPTEWPRGGSFACLRRDTRINRDASDASSTSAAASLTY